MNIPNRTLFTADNLHILRCIDSNSIDLIYLDPPFNTGRQWADPVQGDIKFEDTWKWSDEHQDSHWELGRGSKDIVKLIDGLAEVNGGAWRSYLTYMGVRLMEMERILKSTGSIYFHCDPTMSHGVKLLMDAIFDKGNFRNEIVWHYPNRLSQKGYPFPKMHDVIFFYSKSDNYLKKELLDNNWKPSATQLRRQKQGWEFYKGKLVVYDEEKARASGHNLDAMDYSVGKTGRRRISSVWVMPMINAFAKERTGYPTQKPLALLERIVTASSNEGDVVLDPFCGCATACIAAESLGRKWIGIDMSDKAVGILLNRLEKIDPTGKGGQLRQFIVNWVYHKGSDKALINAVNESIEEWGQKEVTETNQKRKDFYKEIHARMEVYKGGEGVSRHFPTRTDLPNLSTGDKRRMKIDKCEARNGKCIICGEKKIETDMEIDHIIPRAKGGQDIESNFQVICQYCNKIKGNRPMSWAARVVSERKAQEEKAKFDVRMEEE